MYLSESTHLFLPTILYSFNLTQVPQLLPYLHKPLLKKELSLKLTSPIKEMGRLLSGQLKLFLFTALQNRQGESPIHHHSADGLRKKELVTNRISTK